MIDQTVTAPWSPDETGQVTRTCNPSCDVAMDFTIKLLRSSATVPKRTLTRVKSRPRGVWNVPSRRKK